MKAGNLKYATDGQSSFNLLYVNDADDTVGQSAAGVRLRITKQEQGSAPAPSWLMDVSLGTGDPSGGNVHVYLASLLKLKLVCFRYTDEAEGVKPQKKNLELLHLDRIMVRPKVR